MEWKNMTLENFQKVFREFVEQKLSQNQCSQEYVDRLVAKVLVETNAASAVQIAKPETSGRSRIVG